ncbi:MULTISPECIES: hypothetical protein [unclassified Moorena]|uniref:hypothetical protein n=1 Tax=unclassified Moorena TaxID=2683338 RepID=UPI0014014E0D|nr:MULTISPECIES: hypothetical protein [unclassified Moorena]NEO14070.1 hypothetical protein [Moorena sp. SIO3E8]NEQ01505.1 hypothetical protein [Moorena sp. SIO3F7]
MSSCLLPLASCLLPAPCSLLPKTKKFVPHLIDNSYTYVSHPFRRKQLATGTPRATDSD